MKNIKRIQEIKERLFYLDMIDVWTEENSKQFDILTKELKSLEN